MESLYREKLRDRQAAEAGSDPKERGPNGETSSCTRPKRQPLRRKAARAGDANGPELAARRIDVGLAEKPLPRRAERRGADVAAIGPCGFQNYRPAVLAGNVEAARKRRLAASAAGRTYQEQLEYERKSGINTGGRGFSPGSAPRGAGPPGASGGPPPPDQDEDIIVAGLVGGGGGGLTALVFAAREGDRESARLLLDAGADVNQTTEYGWTPLLPRRTTDTTARDVFDRARRRCEPGEQRRVESPLSFTDTAHRRGDYPVPKPTGPSRVHPDPARQGANPNARSRTTRVSRTISRMQWFFRVRRDPVRARGTIERHELLKLLLK